MADNEANTEKARRWAAFVCPDCRFVFKVPKDHDGSGIICSSCRRMLRIPADGEETLPLQASSKTEGFTAIRKIVPGKGAVPATSQAEEFRDENSVLQQWSLPSFENKGNARSGETSVGFYILLGLLFLFTLGGVTLLWDPFEKEDLAQPEVISEVSEPDAEDEFEDELEVEDTIELPSIMQRGELQFIIEARILARRFLNARHVDDILPLVKLSGDTEKNIRSYYRNGKIKPLGMSKFNPSGSPSYRGNHAAVQIVTDDYETKEMAFGETEDGELRIDWESWVGWSEMPWEELLVTKPTKPVLVRVMVKKVDYYNFRFSDEKEWRSYRLTSPDGENVLYGYVKRGSFLDEKVRPMNDLETVTQTLKIRFPEKRFSGSQVLIEEQVTEGWIIESPSTKD